MLYLRTWRGKSCFQGAEKIKGSREAAMLVLAVHHLGIEPFQEFFFEVLFTFVMEDSHEAWGMLQHVQDKE